MGCLCFKADESFKKHDVDKTGTLDKTKMRSFVSEHGSGQLYQTVQLNLDINEEEAKEIATKVAYELAGGTPMSPISKRQFSSFKENFVMSPKGNQSYVFRTIFAAYDTDGNGFIDASELDGFADLFFKENSFVRKDDPRMASFRDKEFKKIMFERCDTNKDGKFSFEEIEGGFSDHFL